MLSSNPRVKTNSIFQEIVPLPRLTEEQALDLANTPIHQRIGVTLEQYLDDDVIKVQEREFAKRFTLLGYKVKWILRSRRIGADGISYLPTNDFIWNYIQWELKTPKVKKYNNIFNMIKKGLRQGKKNYILDFGKSLLTDRLAESLSLYNVRNPKRQIYRLYVLDRECLKKILLQ